MKHLMKLQNENQQAEGANLRNLASTSKLDKVEKF